MAKIHGKDLLLFSGQEAIGASTACTFDVDADLIEISSPTSAIWKDYITSRKSWAMSNNMIATERSISYWAGLVGHVIFVQCRTLDDSDCICGYAILKKVTGRGSVKNLSTLSLALQGCGVLSNEVPEQYLLTAQGEQITDSNNNPLKVKY